MTRRELVRNQRRKQVNEALQNTKKLENIGQRLAGLPGHLRTTFVLDLEEYMGGNHRIILYYPWLQTFNLKKLWQFLRESGFA